MIFEEIKIFYATEKIIVDSGNSLNIIDNSIILLLEQGIFNDDIMPVSARMSLVPCKLI